MVCFKRLAQFVAGDVRRRVEEEGFRSPEGGARIVFRCTARGKDKGFASVELLRQFDQTYVSTRSRASMEDGSSTLHNKSEHVIHDQSKVAELLEQFLDALSERVVELNYDPIEFEMRVETNVKRDGHLTVDVGEIKLPLSETHDAERMKTCEK